MTKAEQTKQSIIEKASILFNEKGIAGTSIDDILKAANVAKGCLYGHFGNKEELSYACVDYMLARITERRNNALNKEKTAKAKIFAFMDNAKNPLQSYIDGGCPIVNLSAESDDTNPVITKKIRHLLNTAINLFTSILKKGIEQGEFSEYLNPQEYALKMFMSIEGANAICRVLNSTKPMHQLITSLKNELDYYTLPTKLQA